MSSASFLVGFALGWLVGVLSVVAGIYIALAWWNRRPVVNSAPLTQQDSPHGDSFKNWRQTDVELVSVGSAGTGEHWCDAVPLKGPAPLPPTCARGICPTPVTCYEGQVCVKRRVLNSRYGGDPLGACRRYDYACTSPDACTDAGRCVDARTRAT